ncbi:MAG: SDR family NAD(P)-dependent oxidoreductase [Pirellulales bacterium]|nr:SDR family NAD(P)-dependent oxidoreductase [Pirellulales bacterium]
MPKRDIRGSRAIVTGASSGIGRALVMELSRQGADVVATARRDDRLRALSEEISAQGGRIEIVVGDITDPQTREKTIQAVHSRFGGLDILVNNAGVGALGLFEHADPARARHVMEVNFFALVEMTRLAFPLLKQGTNPIVVNISSILGHRGAPYSSEYSASKFAVQGFSEAIRAEFTRHEIDVLVVSPGTTQTEFFQSVVERVGEPTWPEHAAVTAEQVARRIVRAMKSGRHEIIPYGWGKVLCWLNRLSPALVDRIMARYA